MSLMTPDLSYYDVNSRIYTLVYVRDEKYSKVRERKIVPGRPTTEMVASSHYYR